MIGGDFEGTLRTTNQTWKQNVCVYVERSETTQLTKYVRNTKLFSDELETGKYVEIGQFCLVKSHDVEGVMWLIQKERMCMSAVFSIIAVQQQNLPLKNGICLWTID